MVFKRGVALLVIAAAAALASVEAEPVKVYTDLKNPVVKDVKTDHGKLILTLQEGATVKKVSKHHAAKHHDEKKKKHHDAVKHTDVKKMDVKKPAAVKVEKKKDQHKKHPAEKKHEAKKAAHKQVSETKADNGEIIRKYAHGQVRVKANNQPAAKTDAKHKKHAKKAEAKKVAAEVDDETDDSASDDSAADDEETDVDLKVGESVTIEFGDHVVGLELQANGSLFLTTDNETYVLPQADSIDLTIDDSDDSDDSGLSDDDVAAGSTPAGTTAGSTQAPASDVTLLGEIEGEASLVAKKFTELATKMTGNGKFFSKDAAPVIFVGGCIGALAAIVGIAAIAIGRSRDNAAAADPSSVLAEATEDVDADVEAAAASTEEESSEDAAAEETQSLSSSDSESDAEEESEEGKFTNGVVSVSV